MGDACHSTFGIVPFIRRFSDVIVLLIPSAIIIVFFLCYRGVFPMCRLRTQQIQWQQNDKAGSFRNERYYAISHLWHCEVVLFAGSSACRLHWNFALCLLHPLALLFFFLFLSKPEVQFLSVPVLQGWWPHVNLWVMVLEFMKCNITPSWMCTFISTLM